eukprot:6465343-Amphidinium_carterae.1
MELPVYVPSAVKNKLLDWSQVSVPRSWLGLPYSCKACHAIGKSPRTFQPRPRSFNTSCTNTGMT